MPYYTFADPDIETSERLVRESFDAGADMIELGIPFSDPIADGPVIQASHQRALTRNPDVGVKEAFELVKRVRSSYSQPLIFMSDINLIEAYGRDAFFQRAQSVGLDGVVIPDLCLEDASEYRALSQQYHVHLIFLISPLCRPDRVKKIVDASTGFIYLISSTGTTGERQDFHENIQKLAEQIKAIKPIPILVGFGISQPEQLKQLFSFSEGGIVGSHLVNIYAQAIENGEDPVSLVTQRLNILKSASR